MESIMVFITLATSAACTIDGLTYMDDMNNRKWYKTSKPPSECNPFYWYPQPIPPHCYITAETPKPPRDGGFTPRPIPLPVPEPLPPLVIPPIPVPAPIPIPIALPPPMPMFMPPPPPQMPIYMPPPPLHIGPPVIPPSIPFLPPTPLQYPPPISPIFQGVVPPIPGIVSKDGGINILPFSDVYSDLLERRRQKKIRRKLEEAVREMDYEYYPKRRKSNSVIPVISYLKSNGKIGNHRVVDFRVSAESAEMNSD